MSSRDGEISFRDACVERKDRNVEARHKLLFPSHLETTLLSCTTSNKQTRLPSHVVFLLQCIISQLVSWCFEPSQPRRITSGLNTNFTLSPNYSFRNSSYHKLSFLSQWIFRGHSTREPACSRLTYFILRAYTGTGVSHSQHRRNRERFWKNAGE